MLASGKLPLDALPGEQGLQECVLGFEFSGLDENGNRVMGMVPSKALATTVITEADNAFLFPVPQHWSLEDGATVLCVYSTAYYALFSRGGMRRGDSVLIHSGSGGKTPSSLRCHHCILSSVQIFPFRSGSGSH